MLHRPNSAARMKILVVEDQALIRMGIVDHLSDAGYEVLEAADAQEAVELIESEMDIALLFTDVDMPGSMSGLHLATAVADRWTDIRIIITSGKVELDTSIVPQGSVYYSKPYSFRLIAGAVEGMLS